MKRMTLHAAVAARQPARRIAIGGFNLLPYRQSDARRGRRRRMLEWLAAAAAGCVAVLALAVWQTAERAQLDAQRASLEHSIAQFGEPLVEHARLSRDEESQHARAARAVTLSGPLEHLLAVLDALSRESDGDVVVQQLRQRNHETELLAASRDHAAPALWLERLGAVRGVTGSEISDLRRATNLKHGAPQNEVGVIEFSARLYWNGTRDYAARAPTLANALSVSANPMRGAK
ncbi:MAG TPA: fimbrial assembly protein [Paraburkholderia sp.]|jgi:type IV pilus assembly protein PilN